VDIINLEYMVFIICLNNNIKNIIYIKGGDWSVSILQELSEFLQAGNVNGVKEGIEKGLGEGLTARELLYDGLMDGMHIIGEKFKNNEIFVPEVLIAARAMNAGMLQLKPKLIETGVKSVGSVVIGRVPVLRFMTWVLIVVRMNLLKQLKNLKLILLGFLLF